MDGIMVFVNVVMIIFAVLQIILFVRVWKMTKSTEIIKNEVFFLNRSLIQVTISQIILLSVFSFFYLYFCLSLGF